ncbi:MAG: hypothetical protein JSW12_09735, partial [Deltaproteobacteria bacterium]
SPVSTPKVAAGFVARKMVGDKTKPLNRGPLNLSSYLQSTLSSLFAQNNGKLVNTIGIYY